MTYAADIIGEFSRQTGIKDKKLDVMLQQQKERKVLWLPQPDSLDKWNFDTMTHTTIGVDVGTNEPPSAFFGEWAFDEPTREQRWYVITGISSWDEDVVDAEWRDVTDVKALPEGECRR